MNEKFYKPREIAAILNISNNSVYRWIADGILRAVRFAGTVRITESELQDFLKRESLKK